MLKPVPLALFCLLPLVGCGVGEGDGPTPPWHQAPTPTAATPPQPEEPVERIPPYHVKLETTKGDVILAVKPDWAPRGAIRFKELVEAGYYDDNRIFRVVPEFVVQFGMHGDPQINAEWQAKPIKDDPVIVPNDRGTVTFATSGPNARTTQIFINLNDNTQLNTMPGSFAPFAQVVEGMDVVDAFNSEHGEAPSQKQEEIAKGGNDYLDKAFPGLDSIVKATIIEAPAETAPSDPKPTADAAAKENPDSEPAAAEAAATPDKPATDTPAETNDESTTPAAEPAAQDAPAKSEPTDDSAATKADPVDDSDK